MRQAYCLYQRVCCSNREFSGPGMQRRKKACRSAGPLADGAHGPGFVNFKYKTVNCHMQARGASRLKYKLRVCPGGTNFTVKIKQACRRDGQFAAIKIKGICHTKRISPELIKLSRYNRKQDLGQAGRRTIKRYCSITARWYGELPSVSGLACVFAKSW